MNGLGYNRGNVPTRPVRVPNLRAQHVLRDVAENVIEYTTALHRDGERANELAMAAVRAAFVTLKHSSDEATADFARLALERVNADGIKALYTFLTDFGDGVVTLPAAA